MLLLMNCIAVNTNECFELSMHLIMLYIPVFVCYYVVFESKVLQKLYPAAPRLEEKSSSSTVETLAKKTCVKRKPTQNDAGKVTVCSLHCTSYKNIFTFWHLPLIHVYDVKNRLIETLLSPLENAGHFIIL